MWRALVCVSTAACSFGMANAPRRPPLGAHVECSDVPLFADGVGIVASATVAYASTTVTSSGRNLELPAIFLTAAVSGILFTISEGDGLFKHHRCAKMADMTSDDVASYYADSAKRYAEAGNCQGAHDEALLLRSVVDVGPTYYDRLLTWPRIAACRAASDASVRAVYERQNTELLRHQQEAEAKQRRIDAQALLKQARDAAAVGDCAGVAGLGAKIEVLDPQTKTVWFDRDAQIAACTAPPAPAQPTESGSP